MIDKDILRLAEKEWKVSKRWYKRAAFNAIMSGKYRLIHGRTGRDVYLVRMWLSQFRPRTENAEGGGWVSENSRLLHFFPRGDDDACLHDHPWDFETEILQGGYVEHLPPLAWFKTDCVLGPAWNERMDIRVKGDKVKHDATDLHCVGAVHPDTWTCVKTKARIRDWGFHPHGQIWQAWRKYLETKTLAAMEHG